MNAISNYLGRYSTPRRLQRIDPGAFYAVDSSVLGPLRLIPGPFTRSEPTRRATKHTWGLARNGIACATAMDHDQQTRRNTITSNPPTLIHSRSFQKRRPFPGQKSIGTVGQNSIGADSVIGEHRGFGSPILCTVRAFLALDLVAKRGYLLALPPPPRGRALGSARNPVEIACRARKTAAKLWGQGEAAFGALSA